MTIGWIPDSIARQRQIEEAEAKLEAEQWQPADITQLFGLMEWIRKQAGMALTEPFRPETTEPSWQPPTPEEKARGISMYQPTGAKERAYEQWQAPGFEFEPAFRLPWTPEEVKEKPWRVDVKGVVEELPLIPFYMAGGIGVKPLAQQAEKILAKQAMGKTITAAERKILEKAAPLLKGEAGMMRLPKPEPKVPAVEPAVVEPTNAAVTKLVSILKVEKPTLRATKALRHEELKKRAAMMGKAITEGEPELALAKAARLRAGKLPSAETPLRDQFTSDEVSHLFGAIRDSELRVFEKARAYDAFKKLILTDSSLQKGEIRLLGEIFGPEFVARFDTLGRRVVKFLLDLANLPRAIIASGEISATLRQGGILLARRPYLAPSMLKQQMKAFFSKRSLGELDDAIRADKDFALFNELGGYMAPIPGKITQLWKAEEAFMTRFARHIPVVAHSERAFIGGLNYLRFHSFKHGKQLFEKMGTTTDEDFRGLLKLINYASGRGEWKLLRGDIGPIANTILFSARLQLSRVQLPTLLFDKSPAVRKEAWRTLIQFMGFGTGVLSMMKLAGATIELDPRSADFGKAKFGETRLDIWTGFLQYARFITQLTTAQRKQTEGGRVVELNRALVARRFVQSKLSPAAGFINDLLEGVSYMGEEMSFKTESLRKQAYNRLMPMWWQDMIDAISEEGLMGGLAAMPGLLGVGVVTHEGEGRVKYPPLPQAPAEGAKKYTWPPK